MSVTLSAMAAEVDFERPPDTEVALSLAFRPLPLTFNDYVDIWLARFRDEFPTLETQASIGMPSSRSRALRDRPSRSR